MNQPGSWTGDQAVDPVTGQTVPEPATFFLSGLGVAGVLVVRRSRVN